MTARDGRRAEKVLVDGAREKVGEMGELSREMDEWSLLDEVGDMRGARRELDGHEAPARPMARSRVDTCLGRVKRCFSHALIFAA